MTTTQIVIISILAILIVICCFGTTLTKNVNKQFGFIVVWLFASMLAIGFLIIMTTLRQDELKLKGKCPEYERVDNLYKLKQ